MTLTLKNINKITITTLFVLFLFILTSHQAQAQEAQTLSISPALFDMSAKPGQLWKSSLRIINVNDYDLTVYVEVVNFSPQGEGGDGKFLPIQAGEADGSTIAEWFSVSKEPITIPREQSYELPISVNVPEDASPGGHFAAILIGTKPIVPEVGQARVQTSQMVTALFFARVAGDISELGQIREFHTTKNYLNTPEATFELRFENKGNIHLQPQGEIKITNMWGQERGIVPINQNSHFGNVLPNSIRKFTFTWKGEWAISDIGRYTAIATLGYGVDSKKFSSAETNFWIIPFKLLLAIVISIIIFFSLVTWFVKLYVRNMLIMAGVDVNEYKKTKSDAVMSNREKYSSKTKLHSPIQAGLIDLRQRLKVTISLLDKFKTIRTFCYQYKTFFIAVLIIVIFIVVLIIYLKNANTSQRNYEVVYENIDFNVTLSSEEIIYNKVKSEQNFSDSAVDLKLPKIKVVNRSGEPGLGAKTRLKLEANNYEVINLSAEFTSPQAKTVIVYNFKNENEALKISALLDNALPSVTDIEDLQDVITVYVGSDIKNE